MAAVLVGAVLLSGCRLDVVTEMDVDRDGTGPVAVELRLDRELLGALDQLGLDTIGRVEAAVERAPGWELVVGGEHDEGLHLRLEHDDGDPAEALAELAAGLSEEDPGLHADLRLDASDDGAVELAGAARLAGPLAAGAVDAAGTPVGPDGEELEALVREHVSGRLLVTLPGPVASHDADALDDRTLLWDLPVGERVEVHARSRPPSLLEGPLPVGAAGVLLALVIAGQLWWLRRRRRARVTRAE